MNLTNKTIEKAHYLVELSKKAKENISPEKSGGILNLIYSDFDRESTIIGNVPKEKFRKYCSLSLEKGIRLYSDWLRQDALDLNKDKIFSSYQTRNPKENKWGGSVLFPNEKIGRPNIISFSGLSEFADEALSLILGYSIGWTGNEELFTKVEKTSQNPIAFEMFYKFQEKYPLENLI